MNTERTSFNHRDRSIHIERECRPRSCLPWQNTCAKIFRWSIPNKLVRFNTYNFLLFCYKMAYLTHFSCSIPNGPVLNGLSTVRIACMTFSLYVYTAISMDETKYLFCDDVEWRHEELVTDERKRVEHVDDADDVQNYGALLELIRREQVWRKQWIFASEKS